ncbi:MAG: hypothetical protein AB1861_19685 [Cyanobacteriota bacterium]
MGACHCYKNTFSVSLAFFSVTIRTHCLGLSYLPQIILRHEVHIPGLFLIVFNIVPHFGALRGDRSLSWSGSVGHQERSLAWSKERSPFWIFEPLHP